MITTAAVVCVVGSYLCSTSLLCPRSGTVIVFLAPFVLDPNLLVFPSTTAFAEARGVTNDELHIGVVTGKSTVISSLKVGDIVKYPVAGQAVDSFNRIESVGVTTAKNIIPKLTQSPFV